MKKTMLILIIISLLALIVFARPIKDRIFETDDWIIEAQYEIDRKNNLVIVYDYKAIGKKVENKTVNLDDFVKEVKKWENQTGYTVVYANNQ